MALTPYQTAARASRAAFYTAGGETVTYARGESSVELSAVRLDRGVMLEDTEGVKSRGTDIAFLIETADLVFGSVDVEPRRSDTITDAAGRVYDVQEGWEELRESAEWQIPVQEVR